MGEYLKRPRCLLGTNLFFGPSRQTAIALDRKAIAAVAATKASNARTQAAERSLLRGLGLRHGVVEGALGESGKADGARVLAARVEVRGRKESTNRGRSRATS